MTYEKAKDVLKVEKECVERQQCDRDCANCDLLMETDDVLSAYDTATEALEKQIPKKPALKKFKFGSDEKICPVCSSYDIFDSEGCELNFCSSCGQAIDWSEKA